MMQFAVLVIHEWKEKKNHQQQNMKAKEIIKTNKNALKKLWIFFSSYFAQFDAIH